MWRTMWRPILRCNSKFWPALRDGVLHVLLPNTCCACRRDLPWRTEEALCASCRSQVKGVGTLYCLRCGKPLPDGGAHCYQCRGSKARQFKCSLIRSAVVFGPQVRGVIHCFKYADQPHRAAYLAQWMHKHWTDYPELAGAELLIPVPLHRKKRKARGYNQSELLAQALGPMLQLPVDSISLVRSRNTPSQTQFGREGRLKNMDGAFTCVRPDAVRGKTILLIDDVATTGATLEGCARALKAAGARRVMAYTLAREV